MAQRLAVFLLVPILPQALFALVRGHFMALSFLAARHGLYLQSRINETEM
jgi:hypothetical protein